MPQRARQPGMPRHVPDAAAKQEYPAWVGVWTPLRSNRSLVAPHPGRMSLVRVKPSWSSILPASRAVRATGRSASTRGYPVPTAAGHARHTAWRECERADEKGNRHARIERIRRLPASFLTIRGVRRMPNTRREFTAVFETERSCTNWIPAGRSARGRTRERVGRVTHGGAARHRRRRPPAFGRGGAWNNMEPRTPRASAPWKGGTRLATSC